MSDFETKTDYLIETKGLLKDRINSLGGSITSGTTFRDYLVWLDSLYEALEEKTITGLPDSLEGKCEQTGTPTPTNPVPINITTGRQVVSVVGKNLLPNNATTQTINNITYTINEDKSIKVNGTANGRADLYLYGSSSDNGEYLYIPKGNYTLNIQNITNGTTFYAFREKTAGTRYQTNTNNGVIELLAQQDCYFYGVMLAVESGKTITNMLIYPQLEKGNQPSTYEEYKGNDYEINLGKNLFDINGTVQVGTLDRYNYGFTLIRGTNRVLNIKLPQMLDAGTYTLSFNMVNSNLSAVNKFGVQAILNGTSVSNNSDNANHKITFTTTSQFNALYFFILSDQSNDATITIDNIQLEKGSQASSFSPYKTPIYLGEIGNYKDYIFRNTTENPLYDSNLEEGQWYIHKEIGRVVLNGSENWNNDGGTQGTDYRHNIYYASRMSIPTAKGTNGTFLSNYFAPRNVTSDVGELGTFYMSNTWLVFPDKNKTYDLAQWKTWLSTHNVEVYYVLNTPTNTLIEDEELINQLNEIEIFTVISEDFYN